MRNVVSRYVILVVTILASMLALASPTTEFGKTVADVGELQPGQDAKAVFTFKNAGDEQLEIKSINASCGCALAKAVLDKLQPGESSTIEVAFQSAGLGGTVTKKVFVYNNDPNNKVVALTVTGTVLSAVKVTPERINFGTMAAGSTREEVVMLTPLDPKTFEIRKIESKGSHVSIQELKRLDDGGSFSIKLLITAGDDPGRVMESVTISSDSRCEHHHLRKCGNGDYRCCKTRLGSSQGQPVWSLRETHPVITRSVHGRKLGHSYRQCGS